MPDGRHLLDREYGQEVFISKERESGIAVYDANCEVVDVYIVPHHACFRAYLSAGHQKVWLFEVWTDNDVVVFAKYQFPDHVAKLWQYIQDSNSRCSFSTR